MSLHNMPLIDFHGLTGGGRFTFDNAEHQVLHCAMLMDEIWVPTPWMANELRQISEQMNLYLKNIVVVPEAVDATLFTPRMLKNNRPEKECDIEEERVNYTKPFQFLSMFKWEHRKGWDVLLKAYWRAFSSTDNVILRLQLIIL